MHPLLSRVPAIPFGKLLIAAFLLIVSCKGTTPAPEPAVLTSFRGSWKITAITVSPAFLYMGYTVTDIKAVLPLLNDNCLNDAVITFNANGSITNNVSSQTSCQNAPFSPKLIALFFGPSTTYTESGNQATLTTSGQATIPGTRTFTATTTTLTVQLPVDPLGDAVPTPYTYAVTLTKQ